MTRPEHIVAVGGGHGLAATLTGLRQVGSQPTAIVSVADDGGSSGRIRAALDVPAVGDLRKAIVALAPPGSPLAAAMAHRFDGGDLEGHAFGNLLIAALAEVGGELVGALDEISRLCGLSGRVLPSSSDPVVLRAVTLSGELIVGQARISGTSGVETLSFDPEDPEVPKEALEALVDADLIVLGPGSLYTSVLAAAAAPRLRDAIMTATAPTVYVCNLRPQLGETSGYSVADHWDALRRHGLEVDVVLYDPSCLDGAEGVVGSWPAAVARPNGLAHDPERLAEALFEAVS